MIMGFFFASEMLASHFMYPSGWSMARTKLKS